MQPSRGPYVAAKARLWVKGRLAHGKGVVWLGDRFAEELAALTNMFRRRVWRGQAGEVVIEEF